MSRFEILGLHTTCELHSDVLDEYKYILYSIARRACEANQPLDGAKPTPAMQSRLANIGGDRHRIVVG